MRISDWSSDVCSSDLIGQDVEVRKLADAKPGNACLHDGMSAVAPEASLRPMDHLLPVDLEMPCAGGAGDALMPGQRLDARGPARGSQIDRKSTGLDSGH